MATPQEMVNTGTMLHGTFLIKNMKYEVLLTDSNISWKKGEGKSADGITFPIIDIVSVKTASSKSSKTGSIDSWILCYAQRKKNNHMRKASVVFIGEQSDCQEWTNRIQQAVDTLVQRPKKILALINPISGWSKGEKEYNFKVAPLFSDANIITDVKVTERANHSHEILGTYDLTTIDCIVFVGGDGMYSEVVNGLMNRKVKESNTNLNDSTVDLPRIDTPIGIIPCGTGNVMADRVYGCKDVETAALSIIIGKRNKASIDTMHSCGEFVRFSIQCVAAGVWSDVAYRTENNRNLEHNSFSVIMTNELLIKSPRPITFNIQYKPSRQTQTRDTQLGMVEHDTDGMAGKCDPKDNSDGAEWLTVEKEYIGTLAFDTNIITDADGTTLDGSTILALKPCTRGQMLTFLGRVAKVDFTTPLDFMEKIKTMEYKIKVVNPSDPTSRNGLIERKVCIDGEPIELKEPEFHIRHFSQRLSLFANVPDDFWITKDNRTDQGN